MGLVRRVQPCTLMACNRFRNGVLMTAGGLLAALTSHGVLPDGAAPLLEALASKASI